MPSKDDCNKWGKMVKLKQRRANEDEAEADKQIAQIKQKMIRGILQSSSGKSGSCPCKSGSNPGKVKPPVKGKLPL